jgi:SAM-dependent methyltransferase
MWNWYDIIHQFYASFSLCPNLIYILFIYFAGQATEQLKPFQEVIGIDPSSVMLDKARASIAQSLKTTETKFQFIQGSAEDLSQTTTLQPESVDLITAGKTYDRNHFFSLSLKIDYLLFINLAQSAHWFDWSKVWPQAHRILRHGGTAAFWVYNLPFLCLLKSY